MNLGIALGGAHKKPKESETSRDTSKFTVTVYSSKPDRERNRDYADAGADRIVHFVSGGQKERSSLPAMDERLGFYNRQTLLLSRLASAGLLRRADGQH